MTTNNTVLNLPYYSYIDTDGSPLFNGFVYVGIANTDPLIAANRIDVSAMQAGGNTVVINQPIRTNSAGLLIDNIGNVIFPVISSVFSIKATDSLGSLVYEESAVNNFGNSVVSTIKKYLITVTNGQTVIDLNVLFSIKPSAVSLYINGRYQQESSGAYIYSSTTGSILLDSPLVTSDEVEVIVNDIVGTSVAFTQPTSEVVSLKDYVTNTIDAGSGLLAACIAGRIVDFAGMTLEVINDFIMPLNSICVEWRFNGATVNFKSSVCYLGKFKNFVIDLQGGTILLGAKRATVTVNSLAGGNTFTVDSTADFVVGDILNSSFSPKYMPDSTSRIATLGEFNTITALTPTTITVKHNVPEVIPANASLMSNRFDKGGIVTDGSGTLVIKNGSIREGGAGYFVTINDPTQQAKFYSDNVIYDGAGLDMFMMLCHSAFWNGGHIGRNYTIAKQGIVAKHHPDGVIAVKNLSVKKYNHDIFIYSNLGYNVVGSYYFENVHIDGINDKVFVGSARDYTGYNSLHVIGAESNATVDTVIGSFTWIGGSVINVTRAVYGTSFILQKSLSYKSFNMTNIIPCQCDPLFFNLSDHVNSHLGYSLIKNCDIQVALSTLNQGVPIEQSSKIVYENCTLTPDGARLGNTSFTISRSILRDCEIKQGVAGEGFKILGIDCILDNIRLPKKKILTSSQLHFLEGYTQRKPTSLVLLDHVIRSSGFIATADYFSGLNSKIPFLEFTIPGIGVKFVHGNPTGTLTTQYRIEYQADSWNGLPYLTRGYTTLYTPINSTIKGSDGTLGKILTNHSTTVSVAAITGATTITLVNVSGLLNNDIIGFLDLSTPSDFVYWYKIINITGFVITIASPLISSIAIGDPARSYTPTKLY